ncbi:hypothetical protein LTR85_006269 [Meristemomyces frigidus]|nr:hypothetical protein LTR85_006269 [Meristemomyces frigidus]
MLPVILLVIYVLQKCYLRTSRQIRYMDLEAVAPLITHCQETISGCTTIRAFGWQRQSLHRSLKLLDNSQQAYYMMFCIQRWLNLVLDLLTAGIAVVVVLLAVELRGTTSTGSIGVALLNILGFNLSLSHGQLQLLAVARALLRPSQLVVLDEVTSSVDSVAETKILDAIHEAFNNSTIIAVAHRLETIVGYDMIVVLDGGRVVEVGRPADLLEKQDGWFMKFVHKAGH